MGAGSLSCAHSCVQVRACSVNACALALIGLHALALIGLHALAPQLGTPAVAQPLCCLRPATACFNPCSINASAASKTQRPTRRHMCKQTVQVLSTWYGCSQSKTDVLQAHCKPRRAQEGGAASWPRPVRHPLWVLACVQAEPSLINFRLCCQRGALWHRLAC